jgi:hypothetical protein
MRKERVWERGVRASQKAAEQRMWKLVALIAAQCRPLPWHRAKVGEKGFDGDWHWIAERRVSIQELRELCGSPDKRRFRTAVTLFLMKNARWRRDGNSIIQHEAIPKGAKLAGTSTPRTAMEEQT